MTSGEGFVLRDGAPRLTTWSCPGRERFLTPESFLVLRRFPRVEHVVDRLTLSSQEKELRGEPSGPLVSPNLLASTLERS